MSAAAHVGFATSLLESIATSIGCGIIVAGFVAATAGMLTGRTRKDLEANVLRDSFLGSMGGVFCLCYDLIVG